MAERTRKNVFFLRLSDDEAYILEEKFKLSGMKSRSEFFRKLLIYGFVYHIDFEAIRENNYQLQKIGNNIAQILKKMNVYGDFDQNDIEDIKKMQEEIWHTQVSIQSSLHSKNL